MTRADTQQENGIMAEQIYYSSLMPRTYLCARLLETLD